MQRKEILTEAELSVCVWSVCVCVCMCVGECVRKKESEREKENWVSCNTRGDTDYSLTPPSVFTIIAVSQSTLRLFVFLLTD